jgi:hypothetical protein
MPLLSLLCFLAVSTGKSLSNSLISSEAFTSLPAFPTSIKALNYPWTTPYLPDLQAKTEFFDAVYSPAEALRQQGYARDYYRWLEREGQGMRKEGVMVFQETDWVIQLSNREMELAFGRCFAGFRR